MSGAQWRVTVILAIVAVLQLATSPSLRKKLGGDFTSGDWLKGGQDSLAFLLGFAIAALILIGLAAVADGIATLIAVIFLIATLLMRADAIAPAVSAAAQGITTLTGQQGSSSSAKP